MAISRHSEEWKLTVGIAMLAGVHFQQVFDSDPRKRRFTGCVWIAEVRGVEIRASSKYSAAQKALAYLKELPTAEETKAHG